MQTVADLQLFHVLKYTITGNKYKFAQIVQETATNVHKFGQLLYKITTQYSRQCLGWFKWKCCARLLPIKSSIPPVSQRNEADSGFC